MVASTKINFMGASQSRQKSQEPVVIASDAPNVNVHMTGSMLRALDRKRQAANAQHDKENLKSTDALIQRVEMDLQTLSNDKVGLKEFKKIDEAEQQVYECYTKNKEFPLNCKSQVDNLLELVKQAQVEANQ